MDLTGFFEPTLRGYLGYCLGFCVRYFAVAGGVYVLLHVCCKRRLLTYRIQRTFPSHAEIGHEIRWSMSNTLCTGLSTLLLYHLIRAGHSAMYFDLATHGWLWFGASVVVGVAGYDAWFYWQHRALHTAWLFRRAHGVHHHIRNPTAFATFAHHPIETFMGNAFFLLFVVLVPIHPMALGLVGVCIFLFGIVQHAGYEFYPRGFTRHAVSGWVNTSTHHNLHHTNVDCNYGLCFNLWDRVMGTNHSAYHEAFDAHTARRHLDSPIVPQAGPPAT